MLTKELFLKAFPHADLGVFEINPMSVKFLYQRKKYDVFVDRIGKGEPLRHYSEDIQRELDLALGVPHKIAHTKNGFPTALLPFKGDAKYDIPAVGFEVRNPQDIKSLLTSLNIYVSPTESFVAKLRDIFQQTYVKHRTQKCAKRWLANPNFQYWPQQLSFAVYCATGGCGVSITDSQISSFPNIIQGVLKFHVYFTTRRVLYELGVALPGDSAFDNTDNPYSKSALNRLIVEFNAKNEDFRWLRGPNNGLGDLYNKRPNGVISSVSSQGMANSNYWPGGWFHFKDESGVDNANKIEYIQNIQHNGTPFDWFAATKGLGLTRPGLSRLNRSIEALTYCLLAAQAKTRVSIYGESGGAIETQQVFIKLVETAIKEDISASVSRFQKAVTDANCKLDLAISPGLWLMPSELKINTDSVYGYNNNLRKASTDMKFGVNNNVNKQKHNILPNHKEPMSPEIHHKDPHLVHHREPPMLEKKTPSLSTAHKRNMAAVAILSVAVGWWLFR